MYGSEGIQQVYGLLTDLFDILAHKDDLTHLLYDDMCHLKKFSENPKRVNLNDVTKKVAGLNKYVDRFHFRNHVDRWCHDNCNPDVDSALKGVNSQVCEQLFKKINSHKNVLSMNEARFSLFFLYQYELHNLDIEGMTVMADPRAEFRWLKVNLEEVDLATLHDEPLEEPVKSLVEEMEALNLERPFKCNECIASFKKAGFLKRHKDTKHESGAGGSCDECNAVFPTAAGLEKHKSKHRICNVCKKEFASKVELDDHKSVHFTCQMCDYDFKTSFNLKRHMESFHPVSTG